MGSVKSTLELIDKASRPLDAINSKLGVTITRFDAAGSSADNMGNKAGIAADKAAIKVGRFSMALDSIPSGLGKINQAMQSVSGRSNSMFKAMLGVAAVQKVLGLVTSQFSEATTRMDTLNNYPAVMSNLGISANEAEKSINDMSERLKGLPTTLQDGAAAVQRFTSANGNVQASTEMFLALNNAILAGGADMQTQKSALEQLSQSYAKGKPDMMEWRSAMTAMPAQMKQVAQAMGYVSADELGEALRKGEVSMDEFMNTMVKMNNESVAGFKTLEEQARNATGGFATSIANMRSAVTRGLTGMIDNINEALSSSGLPTLQEIITNIGSTIEKILKVVGKVFGKIIAWIAENKEAILGWIKTIASIAIAWGIVSAAISAVVGVITLLQTVVSIFGGVFSAILGGVVIAAVAGLANGISGLVDWFTDLNDKTGDVGKTMEIVFANIAVVIAKVKKIFITAVNYMKIAWNTLCLGLEVAFKGAAAVVMEILQAIVDAANFLIKGLVKTIGGIAGAVPGVNSSLVTDTFNSLADGINLGDWAGGIADDLWSQIEDSTIATDKENTALQDEIDAQDGLITEAEKNARELENRYTRNLGNDRGKPEKDKTDPTTSEIADDTSKIAKNTKNIEKQLAVNGENLKYIRDFASQRAINRYTSSEIKVNMTNNNSIKNGLDVDGIMSSLKNKLERELAATAEGVHA